MAQSLCLQCSLKFPDAKPHNRHVLFSSHFTCCKIYILRSLNLSPWDDDLLGDLRKHCQAHRWADVDCYNCGSHRSQPEPSLPKCKTDPKFQCSECPNAGDFDTELELDSHLRTDHGWINCPFSFGSPSSTPCVAAPQIRWEPCERAHMESCPHPNPCNDFDTEDAKTYCWICDVRFVEESKQILHFHVYHRCNKCREYNARYHRVKGDHLLECHTGKKPKPKPEKSKSESRSRPEPPRKSGLIDIYAVLGINPSSSHEEAKLAARQRRIDTHPDKLKRPGMSPAEVSSIDEMAKLVGYAADVVSDPVKRRAYDQKTSTPENGSKER